MKNISFSLTTPQFKARTKDVTRRLGWDDLGPGSVLMAVEKGMGLKKGEKVKKLGAIRVRKIRFERLFIMRLKAYGRREVIREGFPDLTPEQFIQMFCKHNKCTDSTWVTRIEFEYLNTISSQSREGASRKPVA